MGNLPTPASDMSLARPHALTVSSRQRGCMSDRNLRTVRSLPFSSSTSPTSFAVVCADRRSGSLHRANGSEGDGRVTVMPTRGLGSFRQALLGSVTAKVLYDSRCPVLTGPHLENAIHVRSLAPGCFGDSAGLGRVMANPACGGDLARWGAKIREQDRGERRRTPPRVKLVARRQF